MSGSFFKLVELSKVNCSVKIQLPGPKQGCVSSIALGSFFGCATPP